MTLVEDRGGGLFPVSCRATSSRSECRALTSFRSGSRSNKYDVASSAASVVELLHREASKDSISRHKILLLNKFKHKYAE